MKLKLIAVTPAKQKSTPKTNKIAEIGIKIDTNIAKLEKIFTDHGQVYDSAKDYSWLDIYETISSDPVYVDSVLDIIREVKELKAREAEIFEKLASKIIEDCEKSREDKAEEEKLAQVNEFEMINNRINLIEKDIIDEFDHRGYRDDIPKTKFNPEAIYTIFSLMTEDGFKQYQAEHVLHLIEEYHFLKNLESNLIGKLVDKIAEECEKNTCELNCNSSTKATGKDEDWLKRRCRIIQSIEQNCDAINDYEERIDALECDNYCLKEQLESIDAKHGIFCKYTEHLVDRAPDPEANPVESKEELDGDTEDKAPKVRCYIIENSIPREPIIDLLRIFANF